MLNDIYVCINVFIISYVYANHKTFLIERKKILYETLKYFVLFLKTFAKVFFYFLNYFYHILMRINTIINMKAKKQLYFMHNFN